MAIVVIQYDWLENGRQLPLTPLLPVSLCSQFPSCEELFIARISRLAAVINGLVGFHTLVLGTPFVLQP
jgi:hypothetical protein